MKKSITAFFLFLNVLYCFSQQLTEQEYDELSDIFSTDVQLMSGLNDEFENTKLKSDFLILTQLYTNCLKILQQ